ncbi:transmembrane protein [Perilla frutescens var. frutescens]|nr:transmembrane protein [Perilla frutescens var. frutescens]
MANMHALLISASDEEKQAIAEAPTAWKLGKQQHHHHHSSVEKSVAGGGAIVGVLAAVFLVAIFCYIRATRVQPADSFSNGRKMLESDQSAASAARP